MRFVLGLILGVIAALPARANEGRDCAQLFDAALRIEACTRLLTGPGLEGAARAGILRNRGAGHHIAGHWQNALDDYTRALKLAPLAGAYNLRADANMRLCRRAPALADYDRAVALDGVRRVKSLQGFLKRADFYDGPANGIYRPPTRASLRTYIARFKCGAPKG